MSLLRHFNKAVTMNSLTDTSLMPFGKYKNKKMANVPAQYLIWVYENTDIYHHQGVKKYIEDNLEDLRHEANS